MTPNGFAGSIFDLDPATDYECRFVMSDPDGIGGRGRRRSSPCAPAPNRRLLQAGRPTMCIRPATTVRSKNQLSPDCSARTTPGSSHSDNFNTYPARVQPGDTILIHAGIYKDDRHRYGGGLGTVSSGTYFLTQSGTAEKPIVIKGAGRRRGRSSTATARTTCST